MNSHIFPNNANLNTSQPQSVSLPAWHSPAVQWVSMILLIAIVILFPERPAWGNDLVIEADSAGIRGVANGAKLGDVLELLADETGFTIYMDQEVADTAVSFNIPNTIPAERAIQIILHPHSHALVYARTSDPQRVQIDQIQVFYQNPAEPASEPSSAPITEAALDRAPSDDPKLMALSIAYGTE